MKRYLWIVCSVVFAALIAIPCCVSAASINPTKAAIGEGCEAIGDYSTAMGWHTKANDTACTAMGYYTRAIGQYSTTMGYDTEASGPASTAMGWGAKATEHYSTAMGTGTEASGRGSTAMGGGTIAGGDWSFSGGSYMQLTDTAHHTFVWGYAEVDNRQEISIADAFLIFPGGTAGKVGIGTPTPVEKLHIRERTTSLGAAILLDSTGGTGGRQYYVGSTLSANIGGPGIFQIYDDTANQARLNITATGNVGIGTTAPGYLLEVNGDAAKPGGGTWTNSSDERLKDITGEYQQGLDAVARLRPVVFHYKEGNPRRLPTQEEYVGFIAQEVQEVFPEAVSEGPDGYLDFNMHPVNVALVNAVKELKAENDALRQEIAQIKAVLGL